jgi:peptidyl-tRNA hydrolase, PTH1 family
MKKFIVGLGNPGLKYKKTRHNIGFIVIDELEKNISDKDIILLKPDTFMNNSGKAVKKIFKNLPLNSQDLIIVHDDIDLPFGTIKVSKNSSSAGHKGVQSIIDEIGTKDFIRIRIGIKPTHKTDTEKFVLKKFTRQEKKQLKKIVKKAIEKIQEEIISGN